MQLEIKVKNISGHPLPAYQTMHSAGADLQAFIENTITLKPMERVLIPTGLFIALPEGYEAQVRPRSGIALKHGITVLNSPGTIDADYRGEIKILLINLGDQDFEIKNGDRIAQMIISKHETASWQEEIELKETERGKGGYGSTGL
jgi:dUTP pyrophosphatase